MTQKIYDQIHSDCGGLVGKPGKVYGWGGEFCHCPGEAIHSKPAPDAVEKPQEVVCLDCYAHNINENHVCDPVMAGLVKLKNKPQCEHPLCPKHGKRTRGTVLAKCPLDTPDKEAGWD